MEQKNNRYAAGMRKAHFLLLGAAFLISMGFSAVTANAQPKDDQGVPLNTLSQGEKDVGWVLLWDGKTADGWRGANMDHFPDHGWVMKDGVLTVLASNGNEMGGGGDIITDKLYSNFDLRLEFNITPGANSGIKYFVFPNQPNHQGSAIGLEYQVLDDQRHPDAKKGVGGNRTVSSLYDLIPAEGKHVNPPGQWNSARIVVRGGHVEHWLNGKKVVEYDRFSQAFRALIQKSKYAHYKNFGQIPAGHILLQDHGNRVSYRNIMIRVLEPPKDSGELATQ